MLPSDLLAVWKRKNVVLPRYAKLSEDNLEAASNLIEAYKGNMNEKKKVLKELVSEFEDSGYNYRFVRGLAFLLDKRSIFKSYSSLNLVDLRKTIYELAGKFGLPTSPELRKRIIQTAASKLDLTAEKVEEFFYADLDSELILEKFMPLSPRELLEEYNLSLTQTLLFDCIELKFETAGNWQQIFYKVKKLGLIYEVYRDNGFSVKIDGPASLFKLTRRYGTAIAKLLPAIIANSDWIIKAKILWKYTNEICDFKIESSKHRAVLRKTPPPTISYDSSVEEDFATRFKALKSKWLLRREPDAIPTDKRVIIPDFLLEREDLKVYIEIVGFWTEDYLQRKIDKLTKVDVNMLVIVNKTLACEKLTNLSKRLNIIYYQNKIPLSPILRYLEEAFRKVQIKQVEFLKNLPVTFTEPIINYDEFASRVGVSSEAVREVLTRNPPKSYVTLSNSLVRKDILKRIRGRIEERITCTDRLSLLEASKMIEMEGLKDFTDILAVLGYKVIWRGININKAEVFKNVNKRP